MKIATLSSRKLGDVYEGKLKNNYLYNGKEFLDEDADLGWLDYGFRNYDPQIGRFTQLDPLTFSYPYLTPYQYANCDPITNIDIDGLEGESALGNIIGSLTEAAEHGGAVKELTGIVLTPSFAVNRTIKQVQLVLSAGNYIQMTNLIVSIVNSSPAAKQVGNKGPIVMNNQRYNHHTGQYLTKSSSSSSGNSGDGGGKSSSGKNRWGNVFTSEFSGGNNAPPGQTDEDPIKADLLLLMTSSWMGGDAEFAKRWEELIEMFPNKLKDAKEMIETYNELKQRIEVERYLKREYRVETKSNSTNRNDGYTDTRKPENNTPVKYNDKVTKYKRGSVVHTDIGNVTITSDSTRDYTPHKAATDTIPWLKRNKS